MAYVRALLDSITQNTSTHSLFLLISQGLFGKSLDSPAAADADASDTQSVDSGLSRQDSSTGKRDTVCQVSAAAHGPSLFHSLFEKRTSMELYDALTNFVFLCRSARCMERVWWCVKVTVTDSFTWSVLVCRPYLKADSHALNVEMVSESECMVPITSVVFGSLLSQTLCHSFSRQSSLF